MSESNTPRPTGLTVHQASRVLEVSFDDGSAFRLPFEYLRVMSPSAEVRGHGAGQETPQTGKREVGIEEIETVGHYGVRPRFSDGHESGIYGWDYLHALGANHAQWWQEYLDGLAAAGLDRDAPMAAKGGHGCASH